MAEAPECDCLTCTITKLLEERKVTNGEALVALANAAGWAASSASESALVEVCLHFHTLFMGAEEKHRALRRADGSELAEGNCGQVGHA